MKKSTLSTFFYSILPFLFAVSSCTPEVSKLWEYDSGAWSGTPVVYQGKIYAANLEGKVFCLDAKTGEELWSYDTGFFPGPSSPCAYKGKIYLGGKYLGEGSNYPSSKSPGIICLDAVSGEMVWKYDLEKGTESSPAIFDDKVYVGSLDNKLHCLDAQEGKLLWEFELDEGRFFSGIESPTLVAQGRVYFGGYNGKIYCLDATSGEKLWDFTGGTSPLVVVLASPAFYQGKIYVGSYNDKIYCLDSQTGVEIWNYDSGHIIYASPAIYSGKVYGISFREGEPFNEGPAKIFCLDAEEGKVIWENYFGWDGDYPPIPSIWSLHSSPSIAQGKVFVGSWNGKLYCFDASSGSKIWEFNTGGGTCSNPILFSGKILVGSQEGKLYCLDTGDPKVDGWLMFHHDIEHTGDATGWSMEGTFEKTLTVGDSEINTSEAFSGTIALGGYCFNIGTDLSGRWSWVIEDEQITGSISDLEIYLVEEIKSTFPSYDIDAEDLIVVTNEIKSKVSDGMLLNGTINIRVDGSLNNDEGSPLTVIYVFNGVFSGSIQP